MRTSRTALLRSSGLLYPWMMGMYSTGDKLRMSGWAVLLRGLFVAAVVGVSVIPGVSVLGAVIVVSSLLVGWSLLMIWFPPAERRRASGPGGNPSGDRFPRRPLPPNPSLWIERPEPDSLGLHS